MSFDSKKEKREQQKAEIRSNKNKVKKQKMSDFLYFKLWPSMYKKYSKKDINPRLILFADDKVTKIPENMKIIYDKMKMLGYDCKFVGQRDLLPDDVGKIKQYRDAWKYYSRFFKLYARCRCLYLNDSLEMAFACPPRKETNVIQLWNSCGVFKRFANASRAKNTRKAKVVEKRPTHNIYTHVITPSAALNEFYSEAFGCDMDKIYPLGYPKTDFFLNPRAVQKNKEHLFKKVHQLKENLNGRKIILYAPTVRHGASGEAYFQKVLDFMLLKRFLGDKYVFIIKIPQNIKGGYEARGIFREMSNDFMFDVSSKVSLDTALMSADILITDYSTCFYEYSLLEKPMIFFAYDLNRYDGENRFFVDYKDFVPGPIVNDTLELIEAIKATESPDYDKSVVKNFREKYMDACRGNSVADIINGTT